jgi:CheY-like chemotaxis protein
MAKIMLVEDDNNLREIYEARLLAEGYEIVSAHDGEEALALAVKEKPDLIISDVMMPKISGFDMLDILRGTPETRNTKVIMMTALSQAEDKTRADSLGADRYLVKSQVTLEDVARVAREVLEGKEASADSVPASAPTVLPPVADPAAATAPTTSDPVASATTEPPSIANDPAGSLPTEPPADPATPTNEPPASAATAAQPEPSLSIPATPPNSGTPTADSLVNQPTASSDTVQSENTQTPEPTATQPQATPVTPEVSVTDNDLSAAAAALAAAAPAPVTLDAPKVDDTTTGENNATDTPTKTADQEDNNEKPELEQAQSTEAEKQSIDKQVEEFEETANIEPQQITVNEDGTIATTPSSEVTEEQHPTDLKLPGGWSMTETPAVPTDSTAEAESAPPATDSVANAEAPTTPPVARL